MGICMFMRKGETHTKPIALPSGYTRLASIMSNGAQYINTRVKPTNKTRVVFKLSGFPASKHSQSPFGSRGSSSSSDKFVFLAAQDIGAYRTDFYNNNANFVATDSVSGELTIDKNGATTTLSNGVTVTNTDGAFSSNYPIFLFACNTGGSVNMPTNGVSGLECQIYEDGTIIRDYVPCITDGGEVGMYDFVTKEFFGNEGSGAFTGSEVA